MLKQCLREKEIWEVDCVLFEIVQVKVFSLHLSAGFSFDGKGTLFFPSHRIQLIKDTPSAKEGGYSHTKRRGVFIIKSSTVGAFTVHVPFRVLNWKKCDKK